MGELKINRKQGMMKLFCDCKLYMHELTDDGKGGVEIQTYKIASENPTPKTETASTVPPKKEKKKSDSLFPNIFKQEDDDEGEGE